MPKSKNIKLYGSFHMTLGHATAVEYMAFVLGDILEEVARPKKRDRFGAPAPLLTKFKATMANARKVDVVAEDFMAHDGPFYKAVKAMPVDQLVDLWSVFFEWLNINGNTLDDMECGTPPSFMDMEMSSEQVPKPFLDLLEAVLPDVDAYIAKLDAQYKEIETERQKNATAREIAKYTDFLRKNGYTVSKAKAKKA